MKNKLLIILFSVFILMGQMPPNIVIDENEKDIKIKLLMQLYTSNEYSRISS